MKKKENTSWESSSLWYDKIVGNEGHTYHQTVIFPNLLKILNLQGERGERILDLACGQGVLSHQIPKTVPYLGVDAAPSLVASAKKRSTNLFHKFQVGDVTEPLALKKEFSHAVLILAYQNLKEPQKALENAKRALVPGGKMVIVLNHPCFRIPRQSCWDPDPKNGVQHRRISRYMSEMQIPITTHPGKKDSVVTESFHYPLHSIFAHIRGAGFAVAGLQEWCSLKESSGSKAKMENRAREEFPLFLALELTSLSKEAESEASKPPKKEQAPKPPRRDLGKGRHPHGQRRRS